MHTDDIRRNVPAAVHDRAGGKPARRVNGLFFPKSLGMSIKKQDVDAVAAKRLSGLGGPMPKRVKAAVIFSSIVIGDPSVVCTA